MVLELPNKKVRNVGVKGVRKVVSTLGGHLSSIFTGQIFKILEFKVYMNCPRSQLVCDKLASHSRAFCSTSMRFPLSVPMPRDLPFDSQYLLILTLNL